MIKPLANRSTLLATCMESPEIQLVESLTLERAQTLDGDDPAPAIDPAAMLVGHVKLSKARGLQATLVRATLKVPGLMQKGLEHDYKNNLY
jgi:hypothetical protein